MVSQLNIRLTVLSFVVSYFLIIPLLTVLYYSFYKKRHLNAISKRHPEILFGIYISLVVFAINKPLSLLWKFGNQLNLTHSDIRAAQTLDAAS